MTTIHFAFRGVHTAPLPHTCCACGKAPVTGVISYAGKVHEPHCEACCKEWETILAYADRVLTLEHFRGWQALTRTQA